jgi:hypothetical protein
MTRKWIWEEINDQKLFDPVIKLAKSKSENSKKNIEPETRSENYAKNFIPSTRERSHQ